LLPRPEAVPVARDATAAAATALYQSLEHVLAVRGIVRPPALPPLRHALQLSLRQHPLAPEVLALTSIYLDSRFGHRALSAEDIRSYERRVNIVRQTPIDAP
jgi:hypothetical protein